MAVVKTIVVKGDTKQAEQSFEQLGNVIQEQKDITIEFEKELIRLQSLLDKTAKGNLSRQRALRKEIIHVKTAVKEQKIAVKDLNNQQRKSTKATDGLTKSVAKNYGAIQILDQVTGGAATQFRAVVDASRLFNKSLLKLRTALIATGIGAFVVALGLVVLLWDDISDLLTGVNKKLQKQIDLSQDLQKETEFQLELLELKQKLLEIEGESTKEILKLKRELIVELQKENEKELILLKTQQAKITARQLEITLFDRLVAAAKGDLTGLSVFKLSDKDVTRMKEITEAIRDAEKQSASLDIGIAELDNPKEKREKEQKVVGTTGEEIEAQTAKEQKIFEALFDLKEINNQMLLDQQGEFLSIEKQRGIASEAERTELQRSQGIVRARLAEEEAIAKSNSLSIFMNALQAAGEHSKELAIASIVVQRIASIAQIITSTGVANAKAAAALPLTGGLPFTAINTIAAGLSIVAGVAASAKAISELGGSGGGGGGGSAGIPRTAAAPAFNVVQSSPQNQLNQSLLQQNNEPVQAFVVDKEMTNAQELSRNKVAASSMG